MDKDQALQHPASVVVRKFRGKKAAVLNFKTAKAESSKPRGLLSRMSQQPLLNSLKITQSIAPPLV